MRWCWIPSRRHQRRRPHSMPYPRATEFATRTVLQPLSEEESLERFGRVDLTLARDQPR